MNRSDAPPVSESPAATASVSDPLHLGRDAARVVEFSVAGMSCAACSTRLERVLNRQPGMQASVNLASARARVRLVGAVDEAAVCAAVSKAGFSATPVDQE